MLTRGRNRPRNLPVCVDLTGIDRISQAQPVFLARASQPIHLSIYEEHRLTLSHANLSFLSFRLEVYHFESTWKSDRNGRSEKFGPCAQKQPSGNKHSFTTNTVNLPTSFQTITDLNAEACNIGGEGAAYLLDMLTINQVKSITFFHTNVISLMLALDTHHCEFSV